MPFYHKVCGHGAHHIISRRAHQLRQIPHAEILKRLGIVLIHRLLQRPFHGRDATNIGSFLPDGSHTGRELLATLLLQQLTLTPVILIPCGPAQPDRSLKEMGYILVGKLYAVRGKVVLYVFCYRPHPHLPQTHNCHI